MNTNTFTNWSVNVNYNEIIKNPDMLAKPVFNKRQSYYNNFVLHCLIIDTSSLLNIIKMENLSSDLTIGKKNYLTDFSDEEVISGFTEDDYIVKMEPLKKHTIDAEIISIKQGKPTIIELDNSDF